MPNSSLYMRNGWLKFPVSKCSPKHLKIPYLSINPLQFELLKYLKLFLTNALERLVNCEEKLEGTEG